MIHATALARRPFRRLMILSAALIGASASLLAPPMARAFDLARAEADGRLLAEALSLGERGDWASAAAVVAPRGDLVLNDIVLWRKLRAGEGTVREYQSFVDRRANWPGRDQLAEAVLGSRPASPNRLGALTGQALQNWREFDRLYDRRRWDDAEVLLDRLSADPNNLGDPNRWARRRAVLARRAAREGRHELAYRLAARAHTTPSAGYSNADLKWIAGWVALVKLRDPARALTHFEAFAPLVDTPISNGRAGYWIGRAQEAMGNGAAAEAAYASAARFQTSYYGQLAAAKIDAPGDTSLTARELPDWRATPI
ncbi:MAG: hypothetical protein AAF698_06370, partial [Pseudomonadota bacterium]